MMILVPMLSLLSDQGASVAGGELLELLELLMVLPATSYYTSLQSAS